MLANKHGLTVNYLIFGLALPLISFSISATVQGQGSVTAKTQKPVSHRCRTWDGSKIYFFFFFFFFNYFVS